MYRTSSPLAPVPCVERRAERDIPLPKGDKRLWPSYSVFRAAAAILPTDDHEGDQGQDADEQVGEKEIDQDFL